MLKSFLYVFLSFTTAQAATELDLNDISVLLPLPAVEEWNLLPAGDFVAGRGALLPKNYYKKIPPLLGMPTNDAIYPDLRVVGLRFDPCFHEGAPPLQCEQQIRLVWQPLEKVSGVTSTHDASLHVFYDLTADEFKEFLKALTELKKQNATATGFLPLSVNPFIKKEGLKGNYSEQLLKLVFKYIGEENISRITFMQLRNEIIWDFGGFDIKAGATTAITIPRVNSKIQRFGNSAVAPRPVWFRGGLVPQPQQKDNLNILISDSSALTPSDEAEIIEAVRAAAQFENPKLHNPGTVDCVSCHVAQAARTWATRQYPWYDIESKISADTFTSDRDLTNISPMQIHTNILRSFGYFMNRPVVSQRTINESADVIKYIEQNF